MESLNPSSVLIFISPPSLESLSHRLEFRGGITVDQIQSRLSAAELEMEKADLFDYVVVNETDNLEGTINVLKDILIDLGFSLKNN